MRSRLCADVPGAGMHNFTRCGGQAQSFVLQWHMSNCLGISDLASESVIDWPRVKFQLHTQICGQLFGAATAIRNEQRTQEQPTLGGCPSLDSSRHSKSSTFVTMSLQLHKPPQDTRATLAPTCALKIACKSSCRADRSSRENADLGRGQEYTGHT